jgi:arylsulfatase A-like enzyme
LEWVAQCMIKEQSESMNVIVIILDTLRRDHLGCYGNRGIRTPNLDRLARRSTIFANAYIGSYPCMPAR